MTLTLNIHEEDGSYWADVQELPGCFASGSDMNELIEAVQEAVTLYMADNPDASSILHSQPHPPAEHVKLSYPKSPAMPRPNRLAIDEMRTHMHFDADDLIST